MARTAEVIAKFCSYTFPRKIGRWFPNLGDAMVSDKPSWWPVCFFGIGLGLGGFHFGYHNVLTESLILVSGIAAMASFRVQWGAYFFMGLVVGDLFFFRTTYIFQINRYYYYRDTFGWFIRVIGTGLATIIYYYLLSLLCYKIPLFCHKITRKYNSTAQSVLNVGMSGILIYLWALAYPVLIRPIWTWAHSIPPVSAIMPIQQRGGWMVLTVMVATIAREWWDKRTGQSDDSMGIDHTAVKSHELPRKARVLIQTTFGTFLLSGLLMTWWDTTLLFAILLLFAVLRSGNHAYLPKMWVQMTGAIPLWARLLIGLCISWYFASAIHEKLWMIGGKAMFLPLIASFAVTLLVMFLLFPPRQTSNREDM